MRKRRWLLIVVVLLLIGVAFVFEITRLPERRAYRADDLTNAAWQKQFGAPYQIALVNHEEWITDPKLVAQRAAGYPNEDKIPPASVKVYEAEDGKLVVIVSSGPARDDSMALTEWRVDLVQRDSHWQVEWAGRRWVCGRDLFRWGWTTQLCS